ncbi:MAG: M48 family metallopeptidase [Roseiflexaceae bacterium]|nr:M48 family metallopeptidase [Chloroflexaceae bacterium]
MQIIVADIPITLARKRVKYLRLRVVRPGEVVLNVPWHCSVAMAQSFAESQAEWLRQHYVPALTSIPATVRVYGHALAVVQVHARTRHIYRQGDTVVIQHRPSDDVSLLQRMLDRWYQAQLHAVLAVLVPQWQATMQTPAVREWRIRSMRSRWGSCAPRTGVLTFATGLVHYPHDVIAYVVIHELAHLFHPNHAAPFWQCVTRYCPQWRTQRNALRQHEPKQGE